MLETFGAPSRPLVDARQAAFARLVARVIDALNHAVDKRTVEGATRKEIAEKIGCDKSSLSRALNGTSRNLTLKTVSDILWACDFEPEEFSATPLEEIPSARQMAEQIWRRPTAIREDRSAIFVQEMEIAIASPCPGARSDGVILDSGKPMVFAQ